MKKDWAHEYNPKTGSFDKVSKKKSKEDGEYNPETGSFERKSKIKKIKKTTSKPRRTEKPKKKSKNQKVKKSASKPRRTEKLKTKSPKTLNLLGIKLDYNVAGGPWLYGIATGTTSRYQFSSALNAGQWYHACVTFNSSANYITVFIDGAQNHGPYLVQGAFNGTTNTNSLKLGNGSYSTADFRGQIGSSKIYNRLLSQAEIKQNYNAQKSRFT